MGGLVFKKYQRRNGSRGRRVALQNLEETEFGIPDLQQAGEGHRGRTAKLQKSLKEEPLPKKEQENPENRRNPGRREKKKSSSRNPDRKAPQKGFTSDSKRNVHLNRWARKPAVKCRLPLFERAFRAKEK